MTGTSEKIRKVVDDHLLPDAPMGVALLAIADEIDTLHRGMDALAERVDDHEAQDIPI